MIRLEVLGGLRVFRNDEEIRSLPAQPQRAAMLVYLGAEREATRERLCFLLWPDNDPKSARHALSQTLVELKKELGESWFEAVGERLIVASDFEVDLQALANAASFSLT